MKKQAIFSPNKIILPLILPFLLAATLWACLIPPLPAQAQGGDEESWRTLETRFERVGQVLEDKEGNIWVMSWTGQTLSSDKVLTDSDYSEVFACSNSTEPVPHSITETQSAKEISWETIPGEGLAKFEQGDWTIYTAENTNGDLPGDSIHAALFDQEGNLWLAVAENKTVSDSVRTEDVGVVRFDGNQWQTFTVSNTNGGLADNSVRDIFEDQAGHLWFATLAGLSRYDGEKWSVVADESDLGAEGTFRVFQDSKKRLWVTLLNFRNGTSTGCGVARSAPITATGAVTGWQTFTEADGLADDYVLSIAEDAEGDIWFGTFNGISRFDGENWETFKSDNSELPYDFVLQVMPGYEGDMWAATSGGMAQYVSGEWEKFGGDQSTVSIFKDSERLVFFSKVDNGVDYYTGYNRKIFSKANGNFGSNDIIGLVFDEEFIAFKYSNGYAAILHIKNECPVYKKTKTFDIVIFKEILYEYYKNCFYDSSVVDRDGFTWRATNDGLVRFLSDKRSPWLKIAKVNDNELTSSAVALAYDDRRRISIDFEGNDIVTPPKNLQYFYNLKHSSGESDWQQATYDRPIYFHQLAPGKHTLVVKAIDEEGLESEPAKLDITVQQPPLPLLELLIGGLGFATVVGLMVWGKNRLQQQRQQRKARQWDSEHHFNPFMGEIAVKEPEMFFGRQEILHDVLRSIQATNFVIYGEKRIGKTSLLHQIDHHLSEMEGKHFDYLPLVVSFHAMSEERFFRDLMRKMVARIKKMGRYPAEGLFLECEQEADMPYDSISFNGDLDVLQSALDAQSDLALRVVLLVDEADVLKRYSQDTLAQLRETFMVWAGDYLKIVLTCEGPDERAWELEGSPWMSIFGKHYRLTPFTDEEARELIVEPVPNYGYQPEAIERILERSQLVPRHIQNICRQTIHEMLGDKTGTITLDHVESALPKVEKLPPDVTNEEEEEEE